MWKGHGRHELLWDCMNSVCVECGLWQFRILFYNSLLTSTSTKIELRCISNINFSSYRTVEKILNQNQNHFYSISKIQDTAFLLVEMEKMSFYSVIPRKKVKNLSILRTMTMTMTLKKDGRKNGKLERKSNKVFFCYYEGFCCFFNLYLGFSRNVKIPELTD